MFKLLSISKLIMPVFAMLVMITSFPAVNLAQEHEKPEKPTRDIQLLVTGEKGTRFQGKCVVTGPDGLKKRVELEGEVPQEHGFEGEEIHCSLIQIAADGRLEVKLTKDGNTSRSRTRSQGSTVNIRIR